MILFISQEEDKLLKNYVSNLHSSTGIQVIYRNIKNFLSEDNISITCYDNKFTSTINGINFDDIKLCFFNYQTVFYKELFHFKEDLDKEYAMQEWNASFLALCESTKKTKFINKLVNPYDCYTELEDILLFQKFNIDTIDVLLTNNVEDFLTMRDLCNGEIIIKNLMQGYNKMKIFSMEDCKKLNKLHLSPYIFQRPQNGQNSIILNIGDDFLTYIEGYDGLVNIPKGLQEKLLKLKKELNLSIVTYYAVFSNGIFYFYSLNQMFAYNDMAMIFKEDFIDKLTDFIVKEYNR